MNTLHRSHGGLSIDYVKQGNKPVIALAKSIGLNYNLDILIPGNTFLCPGSRFIRANKG